MICAKLKFEAVFGEGMGLHHHGGVIDEDVDVIDKIVDGCSPFPDRFERGQVNLNKHKLDIGVLIADFGCDLLNLGSRSRGQD